MTDDTTTTTTIEVNMDMSARRFPAWMALSVFSAICLAAINSTILKSERDAADKWVMSVTIISMSLSFLAVVFYLVLRAMFVGQHPEAGMILLLLALWGAGLPVIMKPNNDIAVSGETVENANLYFFSWLSFAATLYLSASLAQESYGVDITKTPTKSARWYGLCAASIVAMGAAVRIFKAEECNLDHTGDQLEKCNRTKFAISLGVISFVASIALTYLTQKGLTLVMETAATMLLLTLWCFGVGYITFGRNGPGNKIGNLYFSSWISFILCVFLFGQCFRDYMGRRGDQTANADADQEDPHNGTSPEIPVEDDI